MDEDRAAGGSGLVSADYSRELNEDVSVSFSRLNLRTALVGPRREVKLGHCTLQSMTLKRNTHHDMGVNGRVLVNWTMHYAIVHMYGYNITGEVNQ